MKKKTLMIITCAFLAALVIISVLFVYIGRDHDCCGTDCVICSQINTVGRILGSTLICLAASAITAKAVTEEDFMESTDPFVFAWSDLISMKVKLTN